MITFFAILLCAIFAARSYRLPKQSQSHASVLRGRTFDGTQLRTATPEKLPEQQKRWSPIDPWETEENEELDELEAIDVSDADLLMAGAPEQSTSGEDYSDSLKEMLAQAELNFKMLTTGKKFEEIRQEGAIQEGLSNYREKARQGIDCMMGGDLSAAAQCFDAAQGHNRTQVLLQRGMTEYMLGNYKKASEQLERDVNAMENRNLKLYKATDARLWWSASLRRQGLIEASVDALDLHNRDLEESRHFMLAMLEFYSGKMALEELMEIVGDVSTRDVAGTTYYGNFYIGLYFSACQDIGMARAFLDITVQADKFADTDLWHHLPRLLKDSLTDESQVL